jgi:hypothetical protein
MVTSGPGGYSFFDFVKSGPWSSETNVQLTVDQLQTLPPTHV